MRAAGRDLLSLALIDARNRTLAWLAAFEAQPLAGPLADADPPLWLVGQAAWFQEYWVGRHLQRQQGVGGPRRATRLASMEPLADDWFDPTRRSRAERWAEPLPAPDDLRAYLAATLDNTLELLDGAEPDDDGLYVYRAALWHEDRLAESLAALAQAGGLRPAADTPVALWPEPRVRVPREPLWFPSQPVVLGTPEPAGFVPDNERGQLAQQLPEFEIDAQAVNWAQYAEFVADGGYDDARWWSPEGWAWAQAQGQGTGRRAPRYVEQMTGGVLALRQGRLQRLAGSQAVLHVSAHEAQAWCRWAGRRLPTEAEWQAACEGGAGRGWVWGDAFEWVAGSARNFPGHVDGAAPLDRLPHSPARLLRGASFVTVARQRHPRARRFAEAGRDELFAGFRSCAI